MMQKRLTTSVTISAFLLAGTIAASTVPMDYRDAGFIDLGSRVAQTTELPVIAPSSLRRLTFYSDKAMLALFDLVNEDLIAGEGGTISTQTTDVFRTAIERLIGAGDKAGLDVEQTAVFFGQEVAVRFSGPIPQLLQGNDGGIDARSLFSGIASSKSSGTGQDSDAAYLQALQGETQTMGMPDEEPEVVVPVDDNVDPEFAARVVIIDGERTITVERGDSLADYADAFYGDTLLYRMIYSANSDILTNPNSLSVGQVLVIPHLQ